MLRNYETKDVTTSILSEIDVNVVYGSKLSAQNYNNFQQC